ncbi:MAG: hypothetical protein OER86_02345 [Phycisphaerae bacterium]|nr:hypothetical protein [Phycisphaerae bacterium]
MTTGHVDRRTFVKGTLAQAAALGLGGAHLAAEPLEPPPTPRPAYDGPNVIIVRFGGGVRRRETIDPQHTYSPFMRHELVRRGTLLTDVQISETTRVKDKDVKVATSHGEGTLNILTGGYDQYLGLSRRDPNHDEARLFDGRFEARRPTLFEYFRSAYDIPAHQALLINGEDRTDEEFYSFSNHHLFGVRYRCSVLSLYRFKCHLLRQQVRAGDFTGKRLQKKQKQLTELESLDYRRTDDTRQGPAIEAFWKRWRLHYGDSGLVNPRGDGLLTELAVRAIRQLRPRLMMINYNDPDYVHWGNMTHYTRAIARIDQGITRLVETCDADAEYRNNTLFVIVPDCGRDSNRYMSVPCQHHFNSKSSREIFALLLGPGVGRGRLVDKSVQQIDIAPTVGRLMGMRTAHVEGSPLAEVMA